MVLPCLTPRSLRVSSRMLAPSALVSHLVSPTYRPPIGKQACLLVHIYVGYIRPITGNHTGIPYRVSPDIICAILKTTWTSLYLTYYSTLASGVEPRHL